MKRTLALIAGALAASAALAQEPIASTTIPAGDGADAALLESITQALNADATLKDTKITVQMDDDHVLLTGATTTPELVKRAGSIAAQQAGDQKVVVNAILADKGA
jgi:osmotically-inducible protein OsmY